MTDAAVQGLVVRLLTITFFLIGPFTTFLTRGVAPLLIATGVLVGGLVMWHERRVRLPLDRGGLPLLVFVAWGAVSVAWTPIRDHAVAQTVTFLYVFLPALALFSIVRDLPEAVRCRLEGAFLLGLVLGFPLLVLEALTGQPIYRLAKGLEADAVINQNVLNRPAVIFAVMAWPAALALARRGRRRLACAVPVVALAGVLTTPSQSAQLGAVIGLVLLPLAWGSLRLARHVVAAIAVAGFLGAPFVAQQLHAVGLADAEFLPSSARQRVEIWDFAARRALEQPIFGLGLEASRDVDNRGEQSRFSQSNIIPLHPHNLFLQTWLELGAVGVALGIWVTLALLAAIRHLDALTQRFAVPAFGTVLAIQSTAYGAWQTWWLCGIILAALALVVGARQSRPQPR